MALPLGSRVEIEWEAITTAAASTRQVVVPGVPNLFSAAVVGGQDRVVWVAGQLSFKDGALHGNSIEEQTTGKLQYFKAKESEHRVYGKHCRFSISIPPPSFNSVFIVFVTYLLYSKTPKQVFF